jgi:hypothetical protein
MNYCFLILCDQSLGVTLTETPEIAPPNSEQIKMYYRTSCGALIPKDQLLGAGKGQTQIPEAILALGCHVPHPYP